LSNEIEQYYRDYYAKCGLYTGEKAKDSSRMLVFSDWLKANVPAGGKVLDIGCGDAIFAELLPEFEWYAMDINLEKVGNRVPKERQFEHSLAIAPYPLPDKHFDAIICSEVLEHLWQPEIVHEQARRMLKRDGNYIISTPNFNWVTNHLESHTRLLYDKTQPWVREHINHFNLEVHKRMLAEVGFGVEEFTGADQHYCPVMYGPSIAIQEGLRASGIEVPLSLIHKWMGKGQPTMSHTIIIRAKKC
jgi:SAM-dependent methyltransferase